MLANVPFNPRFRVMTQFYENPKIGVYLCGLNFCHNVEDNFILDDYPSIYPLPYGVVDDVEQGLAIFRRLWIDPDRYFCITFTEERKSDNPPGDGWRWEKWGPYLGSRTPTRQYLSDEEEIERVLVFHIIELKKPEVDLPCLKIPDRFRSYRESLDEETLSRFSEEDLDKSDRMVENLNRMLAKGATPTMIDEEKIARYVEEGYPKKSENHEFE